MPGAVRVPRDSQPRIVFERMGTAVTNVLAFLDPGSGSLLVQGLVAGVASAVVTGKVYWRRAKRFMGFGRDESADE